MAEGNDGTENPNDTPGKSPDDVDSGKQPQQKPQLPPNPSPANFAWQVNRIAPEALRERLAMNQQQLSQAMLAHIFDQSGATDLVNGATFTTFIKRWRIGIFDQDADTFGVPSLGKARATETAVSFEDARDAKNFLVSALEMSEIETSSASGRVLFMYIPEQSV